MWTWPWGQCRWDVPCRGWLIDGTFHVLRRTLGLLLRTLYLDRWCGTFPCMMAPFGDGTLTFDYKTLCKEHGRFSFMMFGHFDEMLGLPWLGWHGTFDDITHFGGLEAPLEMKHCPLSRKHFTFWSIFSTFWVTRPLIEAACATHVSLGALLRGMIWLFS